MANPFVDKFNQLANQQALGGLVRQAAANLLVERARGANEVVTNLNNRLGQIEQTELVSSDERAGVLGGIAEVADSVEDVRDAAVKFQTLDQRISDRQQAYEEAYGGAINALSLVGGEKAGEIARTLEQRLGKKTALLESEREEPLRQIKLATAQLQYDWNSEKYNEAMITKKLAGQASAAHSYMTQLSDWHKMKKGKLSFRSEASLNDHNNLVASVKQQAAKYFEEQGISMSTEAIDAGFANAATMSGMSASWMEVIPKIEDNKDGDALVRFNNALGHAKYMSSIFRNMEPNLRSAVQRAINGEDVDSMNLEKDIDKSLVKTYLHMFGPVNAKGELSDYFQSYSQLQAYDEFGLGFTPTGEYVNQFRNGERYDMVYIPSNPFSFGNNDFSYAPKLPEVDLKFREGDPGDYKFKYSIFNSYLGQDPEISPPAGIKEGEAVLIGEEEEI